MHFFKTAIISALFCPLCMAGVRSGKAEADWIGPASAEAGKPMTTGIRLRLDEGWHTYWENPGEAGMKISVKWDLPEGWQAGDLQHPVPKRFMTGELAGFGYEGTVIFPVTLTPPAGFAGEAKLKAKVSWLTCNDQSCVAGKAELDFQARAGADAPSADEKLIGEALGNVPAQDGRARLGVTEKGESLVLRIEADAARPLDLGGCEVFPATPQVVDSAAKIEFKRDGAGWTAEVPKSEYASPPIKELTLVLAGKTIQPPMSFTWKAE